MNARFRNRQGADIQRVWNRFLRAFDRIKRKLEGMAMAPKERKRCESAMLVAWWCGPMSVPKSYDAPERWESFKKDLKICEAVTKDETLPDVVRRFARRCFVLARAVEAYTHQ